jgi:hypothetical protein
VPPSAPGQARPSAARFTLADGRLPYPDLVARIEACLLDAYETILTCDFTAHRRELPVLADITADAMDKEFIRISPALSTGQLSIAEGLSRILSRVRHPAGAGSRT